MNDEISYCEEMNNPLYVNEGRYAKIICWYCRREWSDFLKINCELKNEVF